MAVFFDADGSDDPAEMAALVDLVLDDRAELVVGARPTAGMPAHQRLGTQFVSGLLRVGFGAAVTDLGPFRAIAWERLRELGMRDRAFGWTAEMQARALRCGMRVAEAPVGWRPGAGRSEISGTLRGSLRAGRDLTRAVVGQALGARLDRIRRPGGRRWRWAAALSWFSR